MKSKGRKGKGKKTDRRQLSETIQESKNLGGRPPKPFNKKQFEELCRIQCTSEEISAVMGVCRETLYNKVQEIYGSESYQTVYKELRQGGNASVRRAQFRSAIDDRNPTMLKWLGQQYLGQEDVSKQKIEAEVKTELSAKIRQEIEAEYKLYADIDLKQRVKHMTDEELEEEAKKYE